MRFSRSPLALRLAGIARQLDTIEASSEAGAHQIAKRIEDYWRARGFDGIKATVQQIKMKYVTKGDAAPVYGVVSNIGPTGYPPRRPA